jgi:hypothetical protein
VERLPKYRALYIAGFIILQSTLCAPPVPFSTIPVDMSSVQESRTLLHIVVALVTATSLAFAAHYINRRGRSRPPGPLGYPLIGNVFHLKESTEPQAIATLGKIYGRCNHTTPIALHHLNYYLRCRGPHIHGGLRDTDCPA